MEYFWFTKCTIRFQTTVSRTRLLKLLIQIRLKSMSRLKKYGFLIEDEDMMAERLGGEINPLRLHPDATNQSETGPMAIFQYMIGNTDWSIPNQHNVEDVARCEYSANCYSI